MMANGRREIGTLATQRPRLKVTAPTGLVEKLELPLERLDDTRRLALGMEDGGHSLTQLRQPGGPISSTPPRSNTTALITW